MLFLIIAPLSFSVWADSYPDATNSVLAGKRDENKYNKGDVIWNLTTEELQVWDGAKWSSLYSTTSKGVSATGELGSVTVAANGATTIYL